MNVLAFDTSMAACSAAVSLSEGGKPGFHHAWEARERGHAEALVPMIMAVMGEAEIGFDALDRLAVTTGPGSFSGVRIGVATARGLALASGLPLVGINTLELMAHNAAARGAFEQAEILAIAQDARRGQVYFALFDHHKAPLSEPMLLDIEDALAMVPHAQAVVAGSGGRLLEAAAREADREIKALLPDLLPDARELAVMAQTRPVAGEPVRPLYLRPPDAKPQRDQMLARQP